MRISIRTGLLVLVVFLAGPARAWSSEPDTFLHPSIPRTWRDSEIKELELPLASSAYSPKHAEERYYYRIPVRAIFRSYPVYHPDREPPGYFESLRERDPEMLWDDAGRRPKLSTESDWLAAGKLVFESPLITGSGRINTSRASDILLRNPKWYQQTGAPVTREGILPFYRYVVRERGKVEVAILSCAMCHTRVLADGTALPGAQGNFPFDRAYAVDLRSDPASLESDRLLERMLFHTPWLQPDRQAEPARMTMEQMAAPHDGVPSGVLSRHRGRADQPVQIPDLIGVQDRLYLDRTGLQRHRGVEDMMRYAALNQGADNLASFGGFVPLAVFAGGQLPPDPAQLPPGLLERYSDEQLYALALYVYSLKPPPNPNLPTSAGQESLIQRGRRVFDREDCARCHRPPLYTNNKLTPARGFTVPIDHPEAANITSTSVGTDPILATQTRRGTGFYKVPSLLGVWYRGPFEHNGSCETLEDWFNPLRTDEAYVPTGWKGPPGTMTRAVKGHEYGMDLPETDRKALIAFLKSL